MKNDAAPQPVRLSDYRPPDYRIDAVHLDFALDPRRTIVKARLELRRAEEAATDAPLVLNGEKIELLSLTCDGETVASDRYQVDDKTLTITGLPAAFTLDIETACAPEANTALSGLYVSNGMFCTQCEAEGFRRITYFLDRPDVLARYSVRIEADKASYPVLLSNGNKIDDGDLPGGRHFVEWRDPHPKPSYLFALVGGALVAVEDSFTTMSGREVALKVFVQPKNKDKCAFTLASLKNAMKWDEETFGREYDLDIFMIVAVDHFNFGAMENKGLNIFNSAYVLASPETATDADFETIESIVGHEYFHNWSGNRVTCRDWFQLCLKEGFTVFRDQEFSSDMRSRAVQRIKDVRRLKSVQFPEDAGPLAHPPRPDHYITIDNFYTATVYEKGAELARMMKTLLGPEKFRAACDLYFARHDGTAATVDDFVKAMEDGGGVDLTQFRRWYSDAGTPTLTVTGDYDEASGDFTLKLAQVTKPTPGQPEKPPRHIPVGFALYGEKSGKRLAAGLAELKAQSAARVLGRFDERPIVSALTGFSAPVTLDQSISLDERLLLAAHDEDLFNRWAASEGLWRDLCLAYAGSKEMADKEDAAARFAGALATSLGKADEDRALTAELMRCPSASELALSAEVIDPDALVRARKEVRRVIAAQLKEELLETYERLRSNAPFEPCAEQAGERALKNAALALLVTSGKDGLAFEQAKNAANMTDEAAATACLAMSDSELRSDALARFYERWKLDALVVNKWLAWRAMSPADNALEDVAALTNHEAYDAGNPNKVRALIAVFARENLAAFHKPDGEGYAFLADQILAIDPKNPQLAAGLTKAAESWRKLEPARQALLKSELSRLASSPGISANLYEMATRLLGASA